MSSTEIWVGCLPSAIRWVVVCCCLVCLEVECCCSLIASCFCSVESYCSWLWLSELVVSFASGALESCQTESSSDNCCFSCFRLRLIALALPFFTQMKCCGFHWQLSYLWGWFFAFISLTVSRQVLCFCSENLLRLWLHDGTAFHLNFRHLSSTSFRCCCRYFHPFDLVWN